METNQNGRSRVLEVRARNVKCLKEVDIDLKTGDIHEIRGDSGQGKTSILQSIEGALRGLDPSMVRNGATEAEIELHLTQATINRIQPADGKEKLMVTDAGGSPIEDPKGFLSTLCGSTAFRPVEWVQLGGGEKRGSTERRRRQRDQLIEAIPMKLSAADVANAVKGLGEEYALTLREVNLGDVQFNQHAFIVCDVIRRACSDFFTLQNSREKDAQAELQHTPAPGRSAPAASVEECAAHAQAAQEAYISARAKQEGRANLAGQVETLRAKVAAEAAELPDADMLAHTTAAYSDKAAQAKEQITRLEEALREARNELQDAESKLRQCQDLQSRMDAQAARTKDLAGLEAELGGAGGDGQDLTALKTALEHAQADLEARKLQDRHDAAAAKAADAAEKLSRIKALVEMFRDEMPKRLLAQAKLPVDGLSIDEEQILIDGVPLHQLGTSQQIRVGVLIAAALNPHSGFVLVDGAESIGRGDRQALAEAAHELGLQLIMTYVDPDAIPAAGVTVMQGGEVVKPAA